MRNVRCNHATKLLLAVLATCVAFASSTTRAAEDSSDDYDPTEISSGIHGKWPKHIRALGLSEQKSYILVLLSPPQSPMDLSTAERFRQTLNGSFIFGDTDIGHAMVGWQCKQADGTLLRGFTGMSGEDSEQSKKMIKGGWGATTFLSTFTDGYLQDSDYIEETIEEALVKDKKHLDIAAIEVSADDCMKTESFLQTFLSHENRPATRFGLVPKPQNFEGGGCGSFAVAMSDQTGVWPAVSELFWRKLVVPKSLMGWKNEPPVDTEAFWPWKQDLRGSQKSGQMSPIDVPLDRLRHTPWIAKAGEASAPLRLIDPELMLLTMRSLKEIANSQVKKQKAKASLAPIEKRVVRLSVPFIGTDGEHEVTQYYYRWVEINAAHDPQANKLVKTVQAWWRQKASDGFMIRPVNKNGIYGVRIEKPQ